MPPLEHRFAIEAERRPCSIPIVNDAYLRAFASPLVPHRPR